MKHPFIDSLFLILSKNQSKTVIREVCWILGNIAIVESTSYVPMLISNKENVNILMKRLEHDPLETKIEILFLINNIILRGKLASLQHLSSLELFETLQTLFKDKHSKIKIRLLEIFGEILKFEEIDKGEIICKLTRIDLYRFLNKTAKCKNGQVSRMAEKMLDKLDEVMEGLTVGVVRD